MQMFVSLIHFDIYKTEVTKIVCIHFIQMFGFKTASLVGWSLEIK